MRISQVVVLCFSFFVANAAAAELDISKALLQQGYTQIPMHLASYQATLLVEGNFGTINYRPFLIDTGCVQTRIDPQVIKWFGFKVSKHSIISGGGDNIRHRVYQVSMPLLRLNNFISQNVFAYVEDQSVKKVDAQAIVGTLGLDYLRRYQALLDVDNKQLYLIQATKPLTADQKIFTLANYGTIPLERTPSGHLIVNVQVNNFSPTNFLVDSGMPITALALNYAKQLNLKVKPWVDGAGSGGGQIKLLQTHIHTLTAGPTSWLPKSAAVMDFKYVQVGVPLSGVIGLDWMQAHHAIIDLTNDLLFVKTSS